MIVVVATGDHAAEMAAITVPHMERFVGPVRVIRDAEDPWGTKLAVGAYAPHPFVLADVDLLFRRRWDPSEALAAAGGGILSAALVSYQSRIPKEYDSLRGRLLNTGLVVGGPKTRHVFRRAIEIRAEIGDSFFLEEGPMNLAARETGVGVNVLDGKLNVQIGHDVESDDDIARHYVGRSVWSHRIRRAQLDASKIPSAGAQ